MNFYRTIPIHTMVETFRMKCSSCADCCKIHINDFISDSGNHNLYSNNCCKEANWMKKGSFDLALIFESIFQQL